MNRKNEVAIVLLGIVLCLFLAKPVAHFVSEIRWHRTFKVVQ